MEAEKISGPALERSAPRDKRSPALKAIIAYKLAKAPVMLALAIWLTFAPNQVYRVALQIAEDLSVASAISARLARWIDEHMTARFLGWGAVLAWLDAGSTALEAVLLLLGKAWGEWLVAIGLSLLLAPELLSLQRRPSWLKVIALVSNGGIVAYLCWRRMRAMRLSRSEPLAPGPQR